MKLRTALVPLAAAAALAAQTVTLTDPDGKPVIGPDGKPATMTLSTVEPVPAGPALSALPPDKVVLAVGDEKVTAAELQSIYEVFPEGARDGVQGAGRQQFAESIVRMKLLAAEARRRKFDQTPAFRAQAVFQVENLLASQFFEELKRTAPVDEAAARAWYEKHKGEYESVRARHILVRMHGSPVPVKPEQKDLSEEEALAKARDLRAKLAAGADFAALAAAESDDAASAANGGDVGTFRRGQMVPSFEEAAFALKAGELSEPVRTRFGYHLIKAESRTARSFEELRPEIEKRLRPELARQVIDDLRKAATITLDPVYYGDPAAAQEKK